MKEFSLHQNIYGSTGVVYNWQEKEYHQIHDVLIRENLFKVSKIEVK